MCAPDRGKITPGVGVIMHEGRTRLDAPLSDLVVPATLAGFRAQCSVMGLCGGGVPSPVEGGVYGVAGGVCDVAGGAAGGGV